MILFDGFDLTEQYLIDRPGRYTVTYKGGGLLVEPREGIAAVFLGGTYADSMKRTSESIVPNTIEIDLKPGELDSRTAIARRLVDVVPSELWFGMSGPHDGYGIGASVGPKSDKALVCRVRIGTGPARGSEEPLGRIAWGEVFAEEGNKASLWPAWREAVVRALDVHR